MDLQYQFELTFKNITLKRLQTKPVVLMVGLLKKDKEAEQILPCFQTEEITLPAYRKQHTLTSIPSFYFKTPKQTTHKNFYIKYQLKGIKQLPTNIEIETSQMINEFQTKKRQVFSQKYDAKGLDLEYEIKISVQQRPVEEFKVYLTQAKSEIQHEEKALSDKSKIKNSISRGRPPLLEIAKVYSDSISEISKANTLSPLPYNQKSQHKDIVGSPYLTDIDSNLQKSDGVTLGKKIKSLPLSEIEKVNELLKSHHQPSQHKQQSHSMSYKLKIVFIMIIIGIISLAYDTINDRFTKNPQKNGHKKSHKNHKNKQKAKGHKSEH